MEANANATYKPVGPPHFTFSVRKFIDAPAQPPATGVAVYTAFFF